jgi:hypothetical protein
VTAPVLIPGGARGLRPADRTHEYVAGGLPTSGGGGFVLPWAIDDLEQAFGIDLYDRMRLDPQVHSALTILAAGILENGFTFSSPIADQADPDYHLAQHIRDEAAAMYHLLPTDNVLYDQLSAIWTGYTIAEVTYGQAADPVHPWPHPLLNVQSIAVKPPWTVAFVVDQTLNILGIAALIANEQPVPIADANALVPIGAGLSPLATAVPAGSVLRTILPRDKFCILTWRPRYSDPRGTSTLRAVWEPWLDKQQLLPEYRRYLAQFAGPSIVGFTPELAGSVPDDETLPVDQQTQISPERDMYNKLLAFQNGTAAAFPGGAKVQPIEVAGEGYPFLRAFARADEQITKGILTVTLASQEAQHSTRAQAQVHQDAQDTLIRQGKRQVCRVHQLDILEQWTLLNWGEGAKRLTPVPSLGFVQQRDMGQMMTGIAQLRAAGYFYSQDQLQGTDTLLGLPPRDLSLPPSLTPAPTGTPAGAAEARITPQHTPVAQPDLPPAPPTPVPDTIQTAQEHPAPAMP